MRVLLVGGHGRAAQLLDDALIPFDRFVLGGNIQDIAADGAQVESHTLWAGEFAAAVPRVDEAWRLAERDGGLKTWYAGSGDCLGSR